MNPKDNMADKDDKVTTTPQETSNEDKSDQNNPKSQTAEEKWQDIVSGKFKTEAEMAKAYKELETKLGDQSKEVQEAREFIGAVQPILNEIRNDPELFKALEKKLSQQKDSSSDGQANKDREGDVDTRQTLEQLIIDKFEMSHGINKLSPDDRRKMREAIGTEVRDLTGQGLEKLDLKRLGKVLEKAYSLVDKENLIGKAKLEALASARNLDEASFPSVPSSGGTKEASLSSEEAKIAQRLGLTREQYLEGKKV